MTAQMHDSILLNDQKFSIVGVNGDDLFKPLDFNLQPRMSITSCWRGYVCEYKIESNKLILNTLQVNLERRGPTIKHVEPLFRGTTFNNVYNHLHLPMDFSGDILAGEKFIRELYEHMGFHTAWKFETVQQLTISHGTVLEIKDVSREMAEIREHRMRLPKQDLEK